MKKFFASLPQFATPLAVLILAAVVVYDHLAVPGRVSPPTTVNGRSLGRAYAPMVAVSLGDAWLAAASALEQGKTVSEAQGVLQTAWRDARVRSFTESVGPEFLKVLPEGQEPTDPAKRLEVVKLWREFASGLKGGR